MELSAHHSFLAGRIAAFLDREEIRVPLYLLDKLLPEDARVYIVGGALRDLVIRECHGSGPATEDIDLFIGNLADEFDLESRMASGRSLPTELGGIRWLPEHTRFAFDLSRLQDFVIFRKYRIEPSLENLLAAVDFTFNAIVYDRTSAALYENRCVQSIRQRLLDFNSTMFYNREITAYRALLLRFKTGFILSEAVFDFLKTNVDVEVLKFVKNLLSARLSRDLAKAVLSDYVRISGFRNYRRYCRGAAETLQ
ncbi:MAG: hypothetical protein AMJ54_12830 [Deltaproteobacteria bacterium SG8_13]|nr:MAG: hypothetical protein AMJ54_12830 [Deltaproteobacteria bacterium SG8_13]